MLDALLWCRKGDGFSGDAEQHRELAVVDTLIAAGDHQNRVVMHHKAEALRDLSDLAADGLRRQWRRRSGMREPADGDAEVQGIQGRLHVVRGQGFHRDRPRETAQSSYSRSWAPGIPTSPRSCVLRGG